MGKSLEKIAKDLAKSIHQSECNFHRKVITEWIHHTQIDVLVDQAIQAVKDRVKSKGLSEEKIYQVLVEKARQVWTENKNITAYTMISGYAKAIHTEMDKAMEGL